MAHHWDEEPNEKESITPMTIAQDLKKIRNKERALRREELETKSNGGIPVVKLDLIDYQNGEDKNNHSKSIKPLKMVREHINMCKSRMRNDPRPIDSTCGCYTCKGFSRAYLHHLFKAKETLGGTLVRPFTALLYCILYHHLFLSFNFFLLHNLNLYGKAHVKSHIYSSEVTALQSIRYSCLTYLFAINPFRSLFIMSIS